MNRLNVSITGLETGQGGRYVPSVAEGIITLMLVAIGVAAFGLAVRFLPVMHHVEEPELVAGEGRDVARAARPRSPRGARRRRSDTPRSVARRLRPWRRLAVRMGLGLGLGRRGDPVARRPAQPRPPARAARGPRGALGRPHGRASSTAPPTTGCSATTPTACGGSSRTSAPRRASTASASTTRRAASACPPLRGRGGHARRQALGRVHRLPRRAAAEGRPRARGPHPHAPRAGRRARPRHHHARSTTRRRAPPATSTRRRSACWASSTCGCRWPRPTPRCAPPSARCSTASSRPAWPCCCSASCCCGRSCCGRCKRLRARDGARRRRRPRRARAGRARGDEMGELARSWNDMTGDLQRAREELEGSNRTLGAARAGEDARSSSRRTTRWWSSRRWPRSASWPRSWRTRSTTRSPASAPTRGCCGASSRRRRGAPPRAEQATETDRILEMVDGEAGRCGDIVRNLLAFSRAVGRALRRGGPRRRSSSAAGCCSTTRPRCSA